MRLVLGFTTAMLIVALMPSGNAATISLSVGASAGCMPHDHEGSIFWVPSSSYTARASGSIDLVLGTFEAHGSGLNLETKDEIAAAPLDYEAYVQDTSADQIVDTVPEGSYVTAEASGKASDGLGTAKARTVKASKYCHNVEHGIDCELLMTLINSPDVEVIAGQYVCAALFGGTWEV